MKRKLLIIPIVIALLIVSMIPTIASNETNTTGVTVADGAGSPGKEVRVKVSVRSTFADYIALAMTYDSTVLTMSEESAWLIEGNNELFDIDAVDGIAAWTADAMEIEGDIFELVFEVNENAEVPSDTTVSCQVLAKWNEDSVLEGADESTVSIKNMAKISGAVTSYGDATAPITVELLNSELVEVDSIVLEAGASAYEFAAEQGNYIVRISKTKHCTRDYEVSMEDMEDKVQDAEVRLYGDVTGDGKVNVRDLTQISKYIAKNDSVISDSDTYLKKVADVTTDEKINVRDMTQISKYIAKNDSVFDDFE